MLNIFQFFIKMMIRGNEFMLELYTNIKMKRLNNNWSQSELAKRVGYSDKSMISKIESGKVDLSQSQIQAFADVFGCTPSELMGWVDMDEISERVEDFKNTMEKVHKYEAMKLYYKYLSATPKTRKMIDMLLEEGE